MTLNKGTSIFRSLFGDTPKIRVLEFLLSARDLDHSIGAIAKGAGINRVTLFRIWQEIERSSLVTHTRRIGNAKLFALNTKNPYVRDLMVLFDSILKTPLLISKAASRTFPFTKKRKRAKKLRRNET
ncbi:MAG TPA: hypothetical protein VJB12_01275 [Candidatus Nanoarchaeia archaeon]|nr:hypothetical protein [Candidatus Nanoarchaeia archaeon]